MRPRNCANKKEKEAILWEILGQFVMTFADLTELYKRTRNWIPAISWSVENSSRTYADYYMVTIFENLNFFDNKTDSYNEC